MKLLWIMRFRWIRIRKTLLFQIRITLLRALKTNFCMIFCHMLVELWEIYDRLTLIASYRCIFDVIFFPYVFKILFFADSANKWKMQILKSHTFKMNRSALISAYHTKNLLLYLSRTFDSCNWTMILIFLYFFWYYY